MTGTDSLMLLLAPFTPQFLRLMNTPEEFIAEGSAYFVLELVAMVITFKIYGPQ